MRFCFFFLHYGWTSWQKSKVALRTVAAAHGALKLLSRAETTAPRASVVRLTQEDWIAQLENHQVSFGTSISSVLKSLLLPSPCHGDSDGRSDCFVLQQRVPAVRSCNATLNFSFLTVQSVTLLGLWLEVEKGLLNSCCSCIADCRNLWYSDYIQPSSGIYPRQFTENY